ncbi:hypothetical protein BDV09DRAFT_200578 [Aspergillus tetrazonus]
MYRTGDRAKLLEDGSLILLGRMDGNTEIKLRGLRVDLEDVASTMVNCHPDLLSSAVVCVKAQGGSEILVAFVALMPGQTASSVELQHLASNLPLPQYMRPSTVIRLDELPRNAKGKIDRKRIETMPWTNPSTISHPSVRLTLGEGELKLLWQALLPGKHIQPESDFFLLGGNSTLLVRLQGAIRNSIGVSLPLRELYSASTLAQMALKVEARKTEAPSTSINWLAETAIPKDIPERTSSRTNTKQPKHSSESGCQILLTGSTSFLGSVLVQALLQVPEVTRVHCIAVEKEQEFVLPTSDKVSVYYGTLLDPTLGLSTTEWASLQRFLESAKPGPNSLPRRICPPVTSPLALYFFRTSDPPVWTDLPGTQITSKWASEVFLERFVEHSGLNISIHRPCTPIGDQTPAQDALNSLLRYFVNLGATPRLTRMKDTWTFRK